MPDPQGALPGRAPADLDPGMPEAGRATADDRRRSRAVVLVSVAVLALSGLALAFFLGTRLRPAPPPAPAPTSSSPTPAPTPSPTPTLAPAPAGPVPPGTYEWDELGGGECIDPFASPWDREFTVVDCAQPHPAQLVARGTFPGDIAAPYPGPDALTSELNLLCTRPEVLDPVAAGQYGDLQWQAAYPAGEEQWREGDRSWFCFVFRGSGQPLTGSVAAPV
ncbi:hypothetical protein [Naasia sp. SYSU D00948]|uniref:hypothetical protein n=1 Tax=Naasia sp. SYSU D00948 TaxID=2817379 RepID=UPI001B311C93|nr:hypothetical protein [Naasia sp. SYSU D00948]